MDKNQLTKLEKYWILYDIGNSAFVLLVSTIIPIYFKTLHLPTEFPFRTPPPTTDTLCLFRH